MISLPDLYRRLVLPVLGGIVFFSAASIIFLLLGDLPRMGRVDPGTVLLVEVILLGITGVVVPFVLVLTRGVRNEPRLVVPIACAATMFVHVATLSDLVNAPGQSLTSVLAASFAGVFLFVSILAFMERQRERPVKSSFSR